MSIEAKIELLTGAIDRLTQAIICSQVDRGQIAEIGKIIKNRTDTPEATETAEESEAEGTEIDRVKKELDELGVKYSNRSKLETLKGKLEEAKTGQMQLELEDGAPKKNKKDEPKSEPKEVTVEEARDLLKKYTMENGSAKALQLLDKLNAKKISDLDAKGRAQLAYEVSL